MDKVYNFPSKTKNGHLKQFVQQEQKLQFFSEEEDSQNGTPKNEESKSSTFKKQSLKQSSQNQGYQTDDSDGGSPKVSSKPGMGKVVLMDYWFEGLKLSKFGNLLISKQLAGDVEDAPEFGEGEFQNSKQLTPTIVQQQEYDIEQQAKKAQEKQKQFPPKYSKVRQSIVEVMGLNQKLGANSDNEKVKRGKLSGCEILASHPFRHLIYGTSVSETQLKKYMLLTQRGLIYAKKCLKGPSENFIKSKEVHMPEARESKEKTLVLDLDETLIHCCQAHERPMIWVTARGDSSEEVKIGINIRPYLGYFLQKMSKVFTIYIFTASSAPYCKAILDQIDPGREYIQGALTRNNCMETKNGFFIKDLRIIGNKKLKDIVIVDNLAHSFGFQIENGIPILEWYSDSSDMELKNLVNLLSEAARCEDVRELLKARLRLDELIEFNLEQ